MRVFASELSRPISVYNTNYVMYTAPHKFIKDYSEDA